MKWHTRENNNIDSRDCVCMMNTIWKSSRTRDFSMITFSNNQMNIERWYVGRTDGCIVQTNTH